MLYLFQNKFNTATEQKYEFLNLDTYTFQKQPPEVFYEKKLFLKISQNSQEKTCARVHFFETLLKQRLWHEYFEDPKTVSSCY